jgi:hypothetical protein
MNPKSSIMSTSVNHNLGQLLAVGSMAIGVAATMSAAPAQAVALNTASLAFDGISSVFRPAAVAKNDFTVTFSSNLAANVSEATGDLAGAGLFPSLGNYAVSSDTVTFDYIGSTGGPNRQYALLDNLNFTFSNGVQVNFLAGALFEGTANANTATLSYSGVGGSFVVGGDTSNATSYTFDFTDTNVNGGDKYNLRAAKEVPEPFSIIGTLIGGTAAFRMKKKLASSSKA